MEMPSVIHPRLIKIGGFTFQVVAYCNLSDQQALNVALFYSRTYKTKKKDRGKIIQIVTHLDKDSARNFG